MAYNMMTIFEVLEINPLTIVVLPVQVVVVQVLLVVTLRLQLVSPILLTMVLSVVDQVMILLEAAVLL
jgi:hypothetical protein